MNANGMRGRGQLAMSFQKGVQEGRKSATATDKQGWKDSMKKGPSQERQPPWTPSDLSFPASEAVWKNKPSL